MAGGQCRLGRSEWITNRPVRHAMQRRVRQAMVSLCLVVVLLAAVLPLPAAAEIDNDLVFEDGHNNNNNNNKEASTHHKSVHHRRANTTFVLLNKKPDHSVSPVSSPIDDLPRATTKTYEAVESTPTGLFGHLHSLGKRLKRGLYGMWGGGDAVKREAEGRDLPTARDAVKREAEGRDVPAARDAVKREAEGEREKRNVHSRPKDLFEAADEGYQLDDQEVDNEFNDLPPRRMAMAALRRGDTDDEDDLIHQGSGYSGHGEMPASPKYYRVTCTINEPYVSAFENRDSAASKAIARNLSAAIRDLYFDTTGKQEANLIRIDKTNEPFAIKVTFDLGSQGNDDAKSLEDRLKRQINDMHRLGSLQANIQDFTFRTFDSHAKPRPGSDCSAEQVPCRSGECLPQETRCNGIEECSDGSDELGCVITPTPAPVSEETTDEARSTEKPVVPVDRCRADDKVRCADGSAYICDAQLCDGIPDCPGGTDEENCPNDCAAGELMCDLSRCIAANKYCDGIRDCEDGTDEHNCPGRCALDQFTCHRDRSCIPLSKKCDKHADCRDGSDEQQCQEPCNAGDFRCKNGKCIPYVRRCDDILDCHDGDDEMECNQICEQHQWQCDFGSCIDRRLRCDGKKDCPEDNSDERNCPCTPSEFECKNKHCIDAWRKCDGTTNCQDGSDEENCNAGCAANEFECASDKICIQIDLKCNKQQDCNDNSDELGCGYHCHSDQFRCDNGICLSLNQRCNNVSECIGGEDERGCATCREHQFPCRNGGCIALSDRCNGYPDCRDGSDEDKCGSGPVTPPSCQSTDIVCGDGKCVDAAKRCNRVYDCIDGADERDCGICTPNEFRCEDGQCLVHEKKCDGRRDCRDGSDELDCVGCRSDQFQCRDGTCIEQRFKCNHYPECRDRSDEEDCEGQRPGCQTWEFTCADGPCINGEYRCDTFPDCRDGSDEAGCPRPTCSPRQFACNNGKCIDGRAKCDGHPDCDDSSDETNCGCQAQEFMCVSGDCVALSARCDRRVDCRDGSDELNCSPAVTAAPLPPTRPPPPPVRCHGEFACRTGNQCVPLSAHCNDRYECQDYSDEDNCPGSPGGLNLKTYPEDQIIKEIAAGREVVFQCRDEGPLRARVHWVRGNNLPLPTGSYDNNGRLEMPNIQVEHSGTYLCQAVGYPKTTPGVSVAVTLSVEPYVPPPTRPTTACGIHESTCVNGECISKHLVCDGKFDCSDGTDENRCSPEGCQPNEFRCANTKCVLKTWRCDSEDDCGDKSDETNCATMPPGSACRYSEFKCHSGNQCIPRSFHCDQEIECLDGSDEVGCSPVYVTVPPPPMIQINVGQVFIITCTAIGVPVPEISWRLNWGHIPPKCISTSVNGLGTLTCPDIQESDQGAYSCEAINNRGSVIATPDTILIVISPKTTCNLGFFNSEARSKDECISCFCFGVTSECKSADLFTYQLPPPFDQYKLVSVRVPQGGSISVRPDFLFGGQAPHVRPIARQGFQVNARSSERMENDLVPYFAMPENYHGNQLKSYGGYLKYTVRYEGSGRPIQAPDVILTGNGYTLVHTIRAPLTASRDNSASVRFFYGEWYKRTEARPGGDIPGEPSEKLATREEIMMALGSTDNILIKSQYISGPSLDTTITDIRMDSAGIRNTDQGLASYVEECRCPSGYAGLSCENCASGFSRHPSGPWLGQCVPETITCRPGTYAHPDPSRNNQCVDCPCPLTNPDNQFGHTCHLDFDGLVTCDCPAGYIGRRCELCAAGYEGNPLHPGDFCKTADQCDLAGSLQVLPNPSTGTCHCKQNTMGSDCNQCQPKSFNLDAANQFGCIKCFCMGITDTCSSSNWYRQQVTSSFVRNTQDFRLVDKDNVNEPIAEGIRLEQNTREIVYNEFSRRSPDTYYWLLPTQFLGDKITSYGGVLNYTIRYVPAPGGQSSPNSSPDVKLLSENQIELWYYGLRQLEPNRQQTMSVPLLEQHWQRYDGKSATRDYMLMALAKVTGLLIKATYTTNTREAALQYVSLDVAEERNTGQPRAMPVEQCSCLPGYRGLSCHECDVGYTRTEGGLYLGLCEPCECNGHSSECAPETGVCVNCRDNTAGENCELCAPGYTGDATEGRPTDCRPVGPPQDCQCNPSGSVSDICRNGGQCECKTNVEGLRCETCRRGCYDLSPANPEGCLECFCSGVTDKCQSSSLYRTQIPMQISDSNHGFTLTDSQRVNVIRDGMDLDASMNEISFTFRDGRRMFWSLPSMFTGNKVTSYGGNLTVTQRFTSRSQPSLDQDVVIIGNGVTIFWTSDHLLEPNRHNTYSVPLREHYWTHLDASGPRPASRADIITALSSVEAILIRATHANPTQTAHLSDVSLDTAVAQPTGQAQAREVEACRCPPAYKGTSCESCSPNHYRDYTDRSLSVYGACKRCPCNGNEDSCSISPDGRGVECSCLPGYAGRFCDRTDVPDVEPRPTRPTPPRPTISISISEPTIQIVEVGSSVRYRCFASSIVTQKPVSLEWSKEGGFLPRDRAIDDHQGLLVITDVRVSDSGTYICSANDGSSIVTERAVLNVGGSPPSAPRAVMEPRSLTVTEGEPVEIRCRATGNPAPNLRWVAQEGRQLGAESSFSNGLFRIAAARKSDEGTYECHANNPSGTDVVQTVLYVREGPTAPVIHLSVSPHEYSGPGGEEVIRFSCLTDGRDRHYTTRWSRAGGRPLPASAVQRDGVLTIYNAGPAESGVYVCTAVSITSGAEEQVEARVTILSFRGPPTVRIEPDRQTVSQGTHAELRCVAVGEPTPVVQWSKVSDELSRNTQVTGDMLRINNVQVNDRGVYMCVAVNEGGTSQASAIVEVERREPPSVELYPKNSQTVTTGGSALLQCRVTGGIPGPTVRWSRPDGRPLSANVEDLEQGVLRFQRVTLAEAGQYVCHAENEAGKVTAVATLVIQSAPTITLLPGKVVTTKVGERVRLECRATGEPLPAVELTKYSAEYPIYAHSATPGMLQSAVYEITRASRTDEGTYICKASNEAGESEDRIQLIVQDGHMDTGRGDIPVDPYDYDPRPTDRPRPVFPPGRNNDGINLDQDVFRVAVGGKADMRCHVKGNLHERIFLDWVRAHNQPMPAGYLVQDGTLFISNVDATAAGDYSCVGRSTSGTILFTANARLEVIAPPRIQLNPTRQVVRPGDHAHITCSAMGDQPMRIEWSALGRAFSSRVTADEGSLQFRGIEVSDAGRYVCKASNGAGEAEAAAEVIVSEHQTQPPVVTPGREQTAQVGSSIQLRCHLSPEHRSPRVTWARDGAHLPRGSTVRGATLELNNVQSSDQGRYRCEVSHEDGSSSDYIDLRVEPVAAPTTVVHIEPSLQVVRVGDTLDVRCLASGAGASNAQVSWTKRNEDLEPNANAYGNLLRITQVRPANGGIYRCSVRTVVGSFTEDYVLAIQDDALLNTESSPVKSRTAPHGSTVVMDCQTDLEAPVEYTWSKHGEPLPKDSLTDEASLTIHDLSAGDAGTYMCTAQNGNVKMEIPTVLIVTGIVPHFAQAPVSYMALPTLPDAYLTFVIEIAFKPEQGDGLILYNGQNRGSDGDFISLGLNDSFVEFRFNMGSGPGLIRSARPVTLGEWHTVKLHRTRKEGMMYVDSDNPIKGTAAGRMQGLDLIEPLYVGGVPDFRNIQRLNGFNKGFVGCISRLQVGAVNHELVRDAKLSSGVTTCETCAVNPCKNQGVCQEANTAQGFTCICPSAFSGPNCGRVGLACYPGACGTGRCVSRPLEGFDCYCPFGRSGVKCQDEIGITEPAFQDEAYLAIPTPKDAVRRLKFALKVNPKTTEDGILLYASQSDDGFGDFASLAIRDNRLEFRFDTGSGPAVLRSDRDLVPGQWVTVSASRDLKNGRLSVNNDAPITGSSPGDKRGLNLLTPLYIGGYDKHKVKLAAGVGVGKSFDGCMSQIYVGGIELDLFSALLDSANVQDCSTVSSNEGAACDYNHCDNNGRCVSSANDQFTCLCAAGFSGRNCEISADVCLSKQQPCLNGGTCKGTGTSYVCRCPLGYSGDKCQDIAELSKDVSFQGDGFIELRNSLLPHKDSNKNEEIQIEFTTSEPNGLIFWHGQEAKMDGRGQDFLALAVVEGYLEFSYELGSGPALIKAAEKRVDDGQRHSVVLKRQGADGSMEVDSQMTAFGESLGILNTLNTRGNIYIGGVENFDLMTGGRFSESFSGCIHKIRFQKTSIHVGDNAVNGVNAQSCSTEKYDDSYENSSDNDIVDTSEGRIH